jgi:hypothetical protein
LKPLWAYRAATLTKRLCRDYGRWPPALDHKQYEFYAQLANRGYFGRWRWALNGLRAVAIVMPIFLTLLMTRPDLLTWHIQFAVITMSSLFALFTALTGLLWLWQRFKRQD